MKRQEVLTCAGSLGILNLQKEKVRKKKVFVLLALLERRKVFVLQDEAKKRRNIV
jgi:ABC-type siderophore export system fused ATPase/permease subunit